MGGLEGKALQDAFGFAPGSGGFAARTRRKKEGSRGPAAPAPPPGEFASSIIIVRKPIVALHKQLPVGQQLAVRCSRSGRFSADPLLPAAAAAARMRCR